MAKQKTISGRFWLKAIWTFTPLLFAIILIVGGVFEVNMRGLIIQAFVMLPLVFAFMG